MTEVLELAAVVWALFGLAKLDRLLRATALLGILFGAIAASGSLDLNINAQVVTGWALAGILIAAFLFHREILGRLRQVPRGASHVPSSAKYSPACICERPGERYRR